jgi:hypothetical protein
MVSILMAQSGPTPIIVIVYVIFDKDIFEIDVKACIE